MAKFKVCSLNDVQYVEVMINNETLVVEAGLMHYYQGDIQVENPMPPAGKFFKSKLSGERAFRPRYHGTGKVVLEPILYDYFALELHDETYIIDKGSFCAADSEINVDIAINKAMTGLLSGEGMVQTLVEGTGTVIMSVPGPVEKIHLNNETLVIDGSFMVARTQSLNFITRKATKSIIGSMTSGEGWVNELQGTGTVLISPIPNHNLLFQEHIVSALTPKAALEKPKPKFQLPGCVVNLLTIGAISFFVYFLFIYYFSQMYKGF